MPDPRFYIIKSPICLGDLAKQCGATICKGNAAQEICSIAPLHQLENGSLSFIRGRRNIPKTPLTMGSIVTSPELAEQIMDWPISIISHPNPQFCFAAMTQKLVSLYPKQTTKIAISKCADIASNVTLGFGVVIEDDVRIGKNTHIGHHVSIARGVHIGENCHIGAGAHISFATIGNHVHILPGTIIGGQGLGITMSEEGLVDIPHFGSVEIADQVTTGANTTIDRGVLLPTRIGSGTKIDNLVQIAHNVQIGKDCILAGHVGISGSVHIGDRVQMGGKVGIIDQKTIGEDAILTAASVVMNDVPAGETWGGDPAQPIRKYHRQLAAFRALKPTKKK